MADVMAAGLVFDGVFAASDLLAIGAMQAMRAAGIQPGSHVSIVGYDDIPAAAAHAPRLTTIQQDWTQGGRLLASVLLARLDPARFSAPDTQVLPVRIITRET